MTSSLLRLLPPHGPDARMTARPCRQLPLPLPGSELRHLAGRLVLLRRRGPANELVTARSRRQPELGRGPETGTMR